MPQLSERQAVVLLGIIAAHVRSGAPVGSRTIVEETGLGVSAATVRNDMAALEEAGYIDHPHISAGRIPTDKGYRWFVDALSARRTHHKEPLVISDDQRAALTHMLGGATDLDDLLKRATSALSRLTRFASLVVAPSFHRSLIKHVELVALGPEQVLAVIIADTGRVTKRMLKLAAPIGSDEVARSGHVVNMAVVGLCAADAPSAITGLIPGAPSELAELLSQLAESWQASNESQPQTLYVGGQSLLMEADPYGQLDHFKRVYETLEEQVSILQVLHDALNDADPAVRIGEELPLRELAPYAVVATKYEATDSCEGHLGILGPTRMDYSATLDAVEVVADVLSDAIGSMTGSSSDNQPA
ncbi:heat-inducible transcriptional repressor HrcA [Stomatohabitans albus]|uniref:heat-inducible transcriptional repressor HrcA n=1 Tax=Stomatohabitans albus TaxID=3110766 RepID=UPI00300CAEA5